MAKKKKELKSVLGTVNGSKLGSSLQGVTMSLPGVSMADITSIINPPQSETVATPLNQYGPTDYNPADYTNTSDTATTTASSAVDIYMNYSEATQTAGELNEVATIISESCSKLSSLLSDANTYWKSSAATLFTNKVEEYMTQMQKYRDFLETKADALRDSSKSYMDFDAAFAQMRIE